MAEGNTSRTPVNKDAGARVINKSGTLQMDERAAGRRVRRDISGRPMGRRDRRGRGRRDRDLTPKEFEEVTIAIDRVSRTVKGGRRMRFKALVAIGNHKNKVGIGVAKGGDVTSAVQKATAKAHRNLIEFAMNGDTICHEVQTKSTGAVVLMKPAAPGTGIIAGGTVRSIVGLTGVKNLISKSLGSTNKVNVAYAVIEGLRAQVPRSEWETTKAGGKPAGKVAKTEGKSVEATGKTTEATDKVAKAKKAKADTEPATKPAAKSAAKPSAEKSAKAAAKSATETPATKQAAKSATETPAKAAAKKESK